MITQGYKTARIRTIGTLDNINRFTESLDIEIISIDYKTTILFMFKGKKPRMENLAEN